MKDQFHISGDFETTKFEIVQVACICFWHKNTHMYNAKVTYLFYFIFFSIFKCFVASLDGWYERIVFKTH